MASDLSIAAINNRTNQLNPSHVAYHMSRGASRAEAARLVRLSQPFNDNRSRQLNPEDEVYASSRGPDDASTPPNSSPDLSE